MTSLSSMALICIAKVWDGGSAPKDDEGYGAVKIAAKSNNFTVGAAMDRRTEARKPGEWYGVSVSGYHQTGI